mmetsp:Transcript_23532/g.52145  ORF Transcript_23532/g.52145 Transcript_23532/m.52145 type:complete len:318 (-) Transcript_23532:184-1137(-)
MVGGGLTEQRLQLLNIITGYFIHLPTLRRLVLDGHGRRLIEVGWRGGHDLHNQRGVGRLARLFATPAVFLGVDVDLSLLVLLLHVGQDFFRRLLAEFGMQVGAADAYYPIPLPLAVHVIVELVEGYFGDVIPSVASCLIDRGNHLVEGLEVIQSLARGHNHDVGLTEGLGGVRGPLVSQNMLLLGRVRFPHLPGILNPPKGAGHYGGQILHGLTDVAHLLAAVRVAAGGMSRRGSTVGPFERVADPLLGVGQYRPDTLPGFGRRWCLIVGWFVVQSGGGPATAADASAACIRIITGTGGRIVKDTPSASRILSKKLF